MTGLVVDGTTISGFEISRSGTLSAEHIRAVEIRRPVPLLEVDFITCVARLCHEVSRIYCESHGDMSQPRWEDAPEWQVASVRSGVTHLLSNKDATPEDTHKNWLADKEADGWVYGAVKDPDAKTHPCMVPYRDLPEQQRHKDALFHTIVRGLS